MLLAAAPSILNALPGVVSGIKNAFDPPKSATFSMKDQPPGPTPPRSSIDDYNESHGVRPGPSTSVSPWNNPPTNFSSNPPPAGVHPFLGVINQGLHSAQQIAGPGDASDFMNAVGKVTGSPEMNELMNFRRGVQKTINSVAGVPITSDAWVKNAEREIATMRAQRSNWSRGDVQDAVRVINDLFDFIVRLESALHQYKWGHRKTVPDPDKFYRALEKWYENSYLEQDTPVYVAVQKAYQRYFQEAQDSRLEKGGEPETDVPGMDYLPDTRFNPSIDQLKGALRRMGGDSDVAPPLPPRSAHLWLTPSEEDINRRKISGDLNTRDAPLFNAPRGMNDEVPSGFDMNVGPPFPIGNNGHPVNSFVMRRRLADPIIVM